MSVQEESGDKHHAIARDIYAYKYSMHGTSTASNKYSEHWIIQRPLDYESPGKFSQIQPNTVGTVFIELSDQPSHTNLFPSKSKPLQFESYLIISRPS